MKKTVAVVGAGFAGLSAAAVMAASGVNTVVYEKNATIGGRARTFGDKGFLFDMGPSWYWMPDVFERFYNQFNHTTADFYELKKLDPGFKVIFEGSEQLDVPADFDELCEVFESIEKGSALHLRKFIRDAEYKYNVALSGLIYKPGHSILEYINFQLIKDVFRLQVFSSFSNYARKYFKDARLLSIIEFPVLFLGAMPKDTPALYSLMNYSGLKQGTWYPMGGFGGVVDAFKKIAEENGAIIKPSENIKSFVVDAGLIKQVVSAKETVTVDAVIGASDYHHIENVLLEDKYRSYPESYWSKLTFAPSCLIFYLGFNSKVEKLSHHNLFFDENFDKHAHEIYKNKNWPTAPLFYVCCPSKTDASVAPEACENLFVLMPIAAGLADSEEVREKYFDIMVSRIEKFVGHTIREKLVFKESYSVSNFINDYNAYKGNAYGLANTLMQTAIFKPKIRSKKISNLFFAGQLTVPGPGVPPSIISGQISANELIKYFNN